MSPTSQTSLWWQFQSWRCNRGVQIIFSSRKLSITCRNIKTDSYEIILQHDFNARLPSSCWERALLLDFHSWYSFFLCKPKHICHFPIWCLRQDVEFDCVSSWSLPFFLLCFVLFFFSSFFFLFLLEHIYLPKVKKECLRKTDINYN